MEQIRVLGNKPGEVVKDKSCRNFAEILEFILNMITMPGNLAMAFTRLALHLKKIILFKNNRL